MVQETSVAKTNISGKWRITEMDLCDQEAIGEEIVAGSGPSEEPSFLEREAGRVFERMLWLITSDNQGVRCVVEEVRAGKAWEENRDQR